MRRPRVFLLVLLFMATGRSSVHGDEVDRLRASFEREIAAFNARDLETLMSNQHEHVVALNPTSPTPVDGKAARRHAYQTAFAATESVTVTPQHPQFRVVDNTGIVWGEYTVTTKPKDKPPTTSTVRFTRTYVKSDGQWRLVLYHVSPLPAPPQ
ncbi:MAG TPA: nuclear transport factor 2 family protein [Methylomirabilota bacterium]|nr:nuclear transport factor 2 family protein [Methylomirabilota bacterium]